MRHGTRAALVAGAVAISIAAWLPLANAATARRKPPTHYVVRGTVVQYIAPSATTVGSVSVRVTSTGTGAKQLTGELVTVAVPPTATSAAPAKRADLAEGSDYQLSVKARSAGSIMKGKGALQTAAAASSTPSAPPAASPPPPAAPPAPPAPPASTPTRTGTRPTQSSPPAAPPAPDAKPLPAPSPSGDTSGKGGDGGKSGDGSGATVTVTVSVPVRHK